MADFELQYPHILTAVLGRPWAILPEKAAVIAELLAARAAGRRFTTEEIAARIIDPLAARREAAASGGMPNNGGAVMVIPIVGTIVPRGEQLTDGSGSISAEAIGRYFRAAIGDPNVRAVVFDIHSPGGSVYGVDELADEILAARGTKPIVAVANALAASAAYRIAASADELVVTRSGEVGSIGVYAMHQDLSRALDTLGVKVTLISAGKYKVEGNPFEPLSEEARAAMQSQIDAYYQSFVAGVAKGRGVGVAAVRENFGQGRTVLATEAVRLGMADRIGTLQDTIARLMPRGARGQSAAYGSAEIEQSEGEQLPEIERTGDPSPAGELVPAAAEPMPEPAAMATPADLEADDAPFWELFQAHADAAFDDWFGTHATAGEPSDDEPSPAHANEELVAALAARIEEAL